MSWELHCNLCTHFYLKNCSEVHILYLSLEMMRIFIIVLPFTWRKFGNIRNFTVMIWYEYPLSFEVTRWFFHEEPKLQPFFCPIPSTFNNLSSFFQNPSWSTSSSPQIILYLHLYSAFLELAGLFCWRLFLTIFSLDLYLRISFSIQACHYPTHFYRLYQ